MADEVPLQTTGGDRLVVVCNWPKKAPGEVCVDSVTMPLVVPICKVRGICAIATQRKVTINMQIKSPLLMPLFD